MEFIKLILFFIIPANIILALLLKLRLDKTVGNFFLLLSAYGIAPLLNGLLFYYGVTFFPGKNEWYYTVGIGLFFLVVLVGVRGTDKIYRKVLLLYKGLITKKWDVGVYIVGVCSVGLFFLVIISIQALIYPVAEGDSAQYFLQTKALSQSNDAKWHKDGAILIDNRNKYGYNGMIQAGIPATVAASFLIVDKETRYLAFKVLSVYYYLLLLGVMIVIVANISKKLGKNGIIAGMSVCIFTIFYWNMTRFYIFNNKEVIIFFLALAGIYVISNIVVLGRRNVKLEILLGVLIGLNAFVNSHGIIIGIFSIAIVAMFSKLPFQKKIMQLLLISGGYLLFSGLQVVDMFDFIFLETWNRLFAEGHNSITVNSIISDGMSSASDNINNTTVLSDSVHAEVIDKVRVTPIDTLARDHVDMYQMSSFSDLYMKGKLQVFTNINAYGLYANAFLLVLILRFKELFSTALSKVTVVFGVVYFMVIIDPFNLNKHPLAIVLCGSPKYSMLIGLLSILIVAVYFNDIVKKITDFVHRRKISTIGITMSSLVGVYFFKDCIVDKSFDFLSMTIKVVRDASFYGEKVNLMYDMILVSLCGINIMLVVVYLLRIKKKTMYNIVMTSCLVAMIVPFFVVDVGKIPLKNTIKMLSYSTEDKLKEIIYFGDLFKVYYYSKEILPRDTVVHTYCSELYTYNEYFYLQKIQAKKSQYSISEKCGGDELFRSGPYALCDVYEKKLQKPQ